MRRKKTEKVFCINCGSYCGAGSGNCSHPSVCSVSENFESRTTSGGNAKKMNSNNDCKLYSHKFWGRYQWRKFWEKQQ